MDPFKIYPQAYKMLENLTAVPVDCGSLCGKACCKDTFADALDSSDQAGMYLYYAEDVMFKNQNDIKLLNLDIDEIHFCKSEDDVKNAKKEFNVENLLEIIRSN